ncbi:MAG: glycine betaine ABC transporter substrate-binding protein, partial [Steroidobacteraceae bacterium]
MSALRVIALGVLLGLMPAWASTPAAASSPATAQPAPARPAPMREGAQCRTIRLSDIGWADVTATTALFGDIVQDLGYQPQVTLLSVPVTFASLKRGNIDVFLGNWMPAQAPIIASYTRDRSIDVIGPNLSGARYTLAVPEYTYAAGLRTFQDIERFGSQLDHTIYGLEPGSPADHIVLGMIQKDLFGLGNFHITASSEAGMLTQVARA